eukprot:172979_1
MTPDNVPEEVADVSPELVADMSSKLKETNLEQTEGEGSTGVVAAADTPIQVAAVDAGTTLTEATEIVDGTTAAETVVEASDAGSPLTDASKIGDGATAAARATMATIDVGTTVTAVEKETIIATGQSDQTEGKKRKADAALTADLKSEVTKKRKFEEGENLAN